jgi:hypothetical protein
MKVLTLLVLAILLVVSGGFAQEVDLATEQSAAPVAEVAAPVAEVAAPVVQAEPIIETIKGIIIDNKCAEANKDDLANFITTHAKSCAILPECIASGYSIYSDGKLMKFDVESNAKVIEFLKKEDSKLAVVVDAKKVGEELSLLTIMNQE